MPAIYCHSCQRQFAVPSNTGECPSCGGGFVEEVAAAQGHAAGDVRTGPTGAQSFARTFTLPGGGRGTVYVSSGPGTQVTQFTLGGGGGGGGMPGAAGADPFVQSVLEAVMGGGFLQPGFGAAAGVPGGGGFGVPVAFGPHGGVPLNLDAAGGAHPGEQEWLDGLMSRIMAEYQPPSQAASQRAVRSLPALRVRARDAAGSPGEGEAVARAGEPCSVCHDEFKEGEEVLELPCSHNYHRDCVLPWLESHNTCPVCRHELPAEDPTVEAQRRQRAGAAPAAGGSSSGGGAAGGSSRQGRQRGSGTRLADLLSSISASWDSLRGQSERSASQDGEAPAEASTRGSAGEGRAAGAPPAEAPAYPTVGGANLAPASSSGSGSSLRQRRDAAALAAERRLRGDLTPPPAAPSAAGQQQAAQAPASQRPEPRSASHPAPRIDYRERVQGAEEEEDGSGAVVAGAVAGGLLGALVGGAMMLFGGRRRDRN